MAQIFDFAAARARTSTHPTPVATRDPMVLGYTRVSSEGQDATLQLDALEQAGCEQFWSDIGSGGLARRTQLDACLRAALPGDTLVVWRLDRLGRSVSHLVALLDQLRQREVRFRSLHEGLDTGTVGGTLIFSVFAALAEYERTLTSERTRAGLSAARARGRLGGRPTVMTPEKVQQARALLDAGGCTAAEVAASLGVSRSAMYRALQHQAAGSGRRGSRAL